jgi:hypothetical protein
MIYLIRWEAGGYIGREGRPLVLTWCLWTFVIIITVIGYMRKTLMSSARLTRSSLALTLIRCTIRCDLLLCSGPGSSYDMDKEDTTIYSLRRALMQTLQIDHRRSLGPERTCASSDGPPGRWAEGRGRSRQRAKMIRRGREEGPGQRTGDWQGQLRRLKMRTVAGHCDDGRCPRRRG